MYTAHLLVYIDAFNKSKQSLQSGKKGKRRRAASTNIAPLSPNPTLNKSSESITMNFNSPKSINPKWEKLKKRALELRPFREALPIFECKSALCKEISENETLVIVGETGIN